MLRLLCAGVLAAACLSVAQTGAGADQGGHGSSIDYEMLGGEASTAPADSSCSLHAPFDDRCMGESACWVNDPAASQEPDALKDERRPHRDDHVAFMACVTPSGDQWARWYWSSQELVPIED